MATCVHRCIGFSPSAFRTNNIHLPSTNGNGNLSEEATDEVWIKLRSEAESDILEDPILTTYYYNLILSHNSLESSIASNLANKLAVSNLLPIIKLQEIFVTIFRSDENIRKSVRNDLRAVRYRDPACAKTVHCFLYYKGFLAVQAHRLAHRLFQEGRRPMAFLIQSRVSEVFGVDIHPGADIGSGILLDHATGVVIGETAVVGNNVSILHNVTLGGTGKVCGDRHPKIGDGVMIGAGAHVLGNVRIGEGAKVGAGSVVLKEVPARMTVVGNPARLVGR